MEAMPKIDLISHQISASLHQSVWSQSLIHNKHQTRIAFTSPFKSTDERIRIGPESRRSRSDRNQNPLKIRIKSSFIPARISCCYSLVSLTHISSRSHSDVGLWVCGVHALGTRGRARERRACARRRRHRSTYRVLVIRWTWCLLQQVCFICINADHYHVTANESIAPAGGVSMETEMLDWHPCSEWKITVVHSWNQSHDPITRVPIAN